MQSSEQQGEEDRQASSSIDPTVAHVRRVQEVCGELCDLNKPISPGPFMGSVTAKVIPEGFIVTVCKGSRGFVTI